MHSGDKIAQLYKEAKKKGSKHCGIYSLMTPNYMVIDLEMVKNVMTKDFQYFVDRRMYVNEKDDPLKKDNGTMIFAESQLFIAVGVLITVIAVGYTYLKWNYQYWKRKGVPYLEPTIPFGNLENGFKRTMHMGDRIAQIYQEAKRNGWKHCGIYILLTPTYLVVDLDMVKNVLTKDFQYFTDRRFYSNEKDDPLSAHLFAVGGKKWMNLRRKLTPTFTTGKLKGMFHYLIDCGSLLEKYLEENVDDIGPVDIKDILGRFSTDVIGSCAFGLNCNSFKEPDSPFRVHGKRVTALTKFDMLKLLFCMSFPEFSRALGFCINSAPVRKFFYKLAQDMVEYRRKNNVFRNDFLQLLVNMKDDGTTLTMDEIAAQCFVFFIAGFETSSTTMTFALFELATHPDIQDKVREEIETVFARHDGKMTYDSLSELKYMMQVIDEVLRKYPPISTLMRECVKDYKVPGEDVVIEKGTGVVIPLKGILYDEEYYEEPEKFDPERFTEKKKRERNRYAHIPFGEGPRICIGERFGIMQSKVGLTSILRRFKVKLNERTELPLKMNINSLVTSTESPIWLDVERISE
ncbi:hypothetical protein NQ318_021706 [Aromia moschata]|uniref:Cytochrome P450 n=1 Tax=Aromia moschata TaxID=1265417 RepID=A0AAV8XBU2_9CUCU|nr:hypothetical protein NQ318_021706 [Aromia moschata]